MSPSTKPRTILAVTGEDDRYRPVRDRAASLAGETGGAVILYDVDAGGLFASPVPTDISADGEQELFAEAARASRLEPDALETAGRTVVADQVRAIRAQGVRAWGWLPSSRDGADLGEYAEQVGASVVLVPPGLQEPALLERLAAHHGTADPAGRTAIPFTVVDDPAADPGNAVHEMDPAHEADPAANPPPADRPSAETQGRPAARATAEIDQHTSGG